MITGIDIVHAQIQIADGIALHSEEMGIPTQEDIPLIWICYSITCNNRRSIK